MNNMKEAIANLEATSMMIQKMADYQYDDHSADNLNWLALSMLREREYLVYGEV